MIPFAMLIATLACPPVAPCPLLDPASRPQPDTVVASVARPDTVHRRARAVEVDDFYELRLRVHRYASYATIPLFVAQTVAGNQLMQADKSGAAKPGWASGVHGAGAAGLGVLFTVNTVTGVWNLWDSRHNDVGRTKRIIHSVLLLAADGGFALAGASGGDDTEGSQASRNRHRDIAYASMGTALVGYSVMLVGGH
jgi:hypothetical protein